MPVCLPPPPPLTAIVREATGFVSTRITPIPTPDVCLATDVPRGGGRAIPGVVDFSQADAQTFSRAPRTWPANLHMVVLHEVLHQVGMNNELESQAQMPLEEGAVEAVTQDLRRPWLLRVRGRDARVSLAYRSWVSSVRRASAGVTGTAWTRPEARAWRATLLTTSPRVRPQLAPNLP
jgi:hypothetical protein